jgi:addiction module HigA family antidote
MEKLRCARNIHPGEVLREEIRYRKLSKRKLAEQLNIPYKVLKDILHEKGSITPDIAMRIESLLDVPAYLYIDMQKDYDIRALEESKKHINLLSKLRALRKHVAL